MTINEPLARALAEVSHSGITEYLHLMPHLEAMGLVTLIDIDNGWMLTDEGRFVLYCGALQQNGIHITTYDAARRH
jgi:hypothetical protein